MDTLYIFIGLSTKVLCDSFSIPYGVFGKIGHVLYVKNELKHIFDYRAKVISDYFSIPEKITLLGG